MSSRGRRRPGERDQHESAFAAILADLVGRVPGARAAALVDREGETVDYFGAGNPYELRVAAAHLRIVLDEAAAQASLATVRSIVVRARRASLSIHALPEGYALVVRLCRGAGFRGLGRAVPVCTRRLALEAGWRHRPQPGEWHPVEVQVDARHGPRTVLVALAASVAARGGGKKKPEHEVRQAPREMPVEILGRYRAALPEHEKAWRVRIPNGVEFTLLRESGGRWYSDEPLAP